MNSAALRNLLIALVVLLGLSFFLLRDPSPDVDDSGGPLFAGLRDNLNDIERVTVARAGEDEIVINRAGDGGWVIANRGDYPADVGTIRAVLLALSDASVLEQKTADPANYEALGVRDPDAEGSRGVRLTATAGDESWSVVLGDANQSSNRFVRRTGEDQSLLIDQNVDLPEAMTGWLDTALLDIDPADVQRVRISHGDGETIEISKAERGEADFVVEAIPEDRELSYPSVGNSIAGALNDLTLEDVRTAGDAAEPETRVAVTTFDGLGVGLAVYPGDEETWVSVDASVRMPAGDDADADSADAGDAAEDDAETGEANQADQAGGDEDAVIDADADEEASTVDPAERAEEINARTGGWQFLLPSYKANQLTRRWDDLLAPLPEEDDESGESEQ